MQSFGYRRYLPLGRPEVLVENLDRWGADEIVLDPFLRHPFPPVSRVRALADRVAAARLIIRTLRPHQWLKNLLIFVPVLAGQRYSDPAAVLHAALAFLAFSLAASSVYVTNDVLDLSHDRRHPTKRRRPFASGALRVSQSVPLALALLLLSAVVSSAVVQPDSGWKNRGS